MDGRLVNIVSRADLSRAVLELVVKLGAEVRVRDTRIRAALRAEMRAETQANSLTTFADVENGIVTLHGYVESDTVRRGLHVLVERIDGVERLDDHMIDGLVSPMAGLGYGAHVGRSVILMTAPA